MLTIHTIKTIKAFLQRQLNRKKGYEKNEKMLIRQLTQIDRCFLHFML